MRGRGAGATGRQSAARAVQRLGVLVQAGVAPLEAWRALAAHPGADPIVAAAAGAPTAHEVIPLLLEALEDHSASRRAEWAPVVAAWRVATEAGAPLGPTLARLAEALRDSTRIERQARTALAGPAASARVIVLLPVAAVLLGVLLGFDSVRVLATTPVGWACLAIGGALLTAGALWIRRMLARSRQRDPAPGLIEELAAVALGGGASADHALALAIDAAAEAGLVGDAAPPRSTLDFAARSGVPAAALLRAEAADARLSAAADAEEAAARLGVTLLLPLGLCLLPSFVVLGVVPILVALLESSSIGLRG